MKKKVLLLLSIAAIASLAACKTKTSSVEPSSEAPVSSVVPSSEPSSAPSSQTPSSSAAPSSSSQAPSSSRAPSSSQAPSSSSTPEPVTTDIVIPATEYEEDIEEEAPYADKLLLNRRYISVAVGQNAPEAITSQAIRGLPQPLQTGLNLAYKVADETIATVDENGVVKGLKEGNTTIEVSDKAHPEVKSVLPVKVFSSIALLEDWPEVEEGQELPADVKEKQEKVLGQINKLKEVDEKGLTEIVDHELYEKTKLKNGVAQSYAVWDQNLVASIDDAYFRIYERDGDVKTQNGAISFKDYEWIFNTNQYYDTYTYHTTGDVKNYFVASTVDYMEAGDRTAPLFDILDNIFTSGHEIFTNLFENCKLESFFEYVEKNYSNVYKNCAGYYLDQSGNPIEGSFFFDCVLSLDNITADQDDETRYGIPFGTPTPTTYNLRFTVEDNKLVGYSNHGVMTYDIGDDHYEEIYDIDHFYERIDDSNRDQFIFTPDNSEYTLVDYLFAV